MREKPKLYRKRVLLVFVIISGVLLAWLMVPMIYNPIRRPAPMIRSHILRHTPIGMCIEEAIEIIESRSRWGDPEIRRDVGFIHPNPGGSAGSRWDYDGRIGPLFVGEQSIRIFHRYSSPLFPLDRVVRILWGFDENGKLIEVYVSSSGGT